MVWGKNVKQRHNFFKFNHLKILSYSSFNQFKFQQQGKNCREHSENKECDKIMRWLQEQDSLEDAMVGKTENTPT